jgi:murein DD-endopeptidase MepM/ murein hydrolase activator NlpD
MACRFSWAGGFACAAALSALSLLPSTVRADEPRPPIARAFVFPIGDELDFTKPAPGEGVGFHVSDPYLALRRARKHRPRRVHYGVDLSSGQSGNVVRAVAAGVVDVSEGNALVKYRKAERFKVPKVVNGKRIYASGTRYRTAYRWRTGWGNRVVLRHTLADGQVVYSLYAHLLKRSVLVRKGDVVSAGQPIARVGRTGRASSPHLHLEIRTTRVDESAEISDPDDDSNAGYEREDENRAETQLPHTVDPLAFLVDHVLRFEDLEPGSWQARYALAAVKDGMMSSSRKRFEPDDAISRDDFYGALVTAFQLGTPFTKNEFSSSVDALIDSGILDLSSRPRQDAGDRVERSEALELVLRCLDRGAASGQSMAKIGSDQLARDFNVEFAGKEEAAAAEVEARRLAAVETEAQRKASSARAERLAKEARARGVPPAKRAKVQAVKPIPMLDPGFESLAQSKKNLSRAEACLLIASALRLGSSSLSGLQRAATRAANSG